MHKLRVIVLNVVLSAIAVAVASTAFLVDRLIPFALPPGLQVLAWPLLLFGVFLILWAALVLARGSGASGAPGDPTSRLVKEGPYAWIRNPIYAGDVLLLVGLALYLGSLGLLIYSVLFGIAIHVFVRQVEEPFTEKRLGGEYATYKAEVPRWFPKIRRGDGNE